MNWRQGARSLTAFDSPVSLAVVIVVQPRLRVGAAMLLTLALVDAPAGEEPHQLQEAQSEKYVRDVLMPVLHLVLYCVHIMRALRRMPVPSGASGAVSVPARGFNLAPAGSRQQRDRVLTILLIPTALVEL